MKRIFAADRLSRWLLVCSLFVMPHAADAEEPLPVGPDITSYSMQRWIFSPGLSTSLRFADGAAQFAVGAEASLFHFQFDDKERFLPWHLRWFGGFVDANYNIDANVGNFRVGPELGMSIVGVDGGVTMRVDQDGVKFGWSVRPAISLAWVAAFVRFESVADTPFTYEVGLLFKVPLTRRVE